MNSESTSKWANALQSLILAISIPIAGYWTYDTFLVTHEAEKTKAEYQKLEIELRERRSIEINLSPRQEVAGNKTALVTKIVILNAGNQYEQVQLDQVFLDLYLVGGEEARGASRLQKIATDLISFPGVSPSKFSLDAGENVELLAIAYVEVSGLYAMRLIVPNNISITSDGLATSMYSAVDYISVNIP